MSAKVQPHLKVKLGDLAPYCLLAGDPGRVDRIASNFLKEAKEVARYRGFVVHTGTYKEVPVSAASTGIGTPSACIVVEELARVGVTTMIRVGTCGSMQAHIDQGDIVIATAATRTDGATRAYAPVECPAVADMEVTSALAKMAEDLGLKYYLGPVFTSDAFYAEDTEFASRWGAMGVLAVEMECSGIFLLGGLRRLRTGAILAVDGNLVKGRHKDEFEEGKENGEVHPLVRVAVDDEIRVALEAIKSLEGGKR